MGSYSYNLDLAVLPGAKVTLFHAGDWSKKPIDENTVWQDKAQTDDAGNFTILA